MKKRMLIGVAAILAVIASYGVAGMLSVSVTESGTVVGLTKELVISASTAGVVSGAAAFGTTLTLPACLSALATSVTFQDIATATISWGTTLQSNTDYEIWFCLGNIGTSAGTVHVSTTGQAVGETEVFEQATSSLTGLVFSPCDGATIAGNGVIAVRAHLHTPTVGLNSQQALTGKTTFTFG
jgi:hypothetical protein